MAKNLVAQVGKAGGEFELVEREIPAPAAGEVRIKVKACGICFSDHLVKDGLWPGLQFPRVPGHEAVGVVDEVGAGVTEWKKGDRVGVGWHGGHDFTCANCRRGDFVTCVNEPITGVTRDGGFAQYMIARHEAVALLPGEIDWAEAGPLMCAGITTFNALRNSGARMGDLVAVQGIGGLGHLGIQFAAKAGYRTVGIGRGPENAALAKKLGAHAYLDTKATNAAEALQKMGGAKVILATAPNAKAMSEMIGGLGVGGKLLVVGAPFEPMEVSVVQLLMARRGIQGWPSGTAMDSQETLEFSAYSGVRPMVEKFPLTKVKEAYERMTSGKAEFRVVLTME
ncbi:MAG TPA: alcohol dehydrogenase [Candidatus Sulfotelmatobacter sp.]|jgi:D-arabinose 1-dehydrogenase-like Zn-dependent alcohol dehydrogenase|nr:alcohol dehydrogenase [Candidatus Sulfotelmatobacter sp.]